MISFTEENYLKAIYKLNDHLKGEVSTNAIAEELKTKASSVTDMVKKLNDKGLVNYKKYQGVTLTVEGKNIAINIIRKHRLWEVFLVEKLNFKWDEVHELAEQLEHVVSPELTERLDQFLDYPKYDPHGDPIPDKDGNIFTHKDVSLTDLNPGDSGVIVGVREHSKSYLNYLESLNLMLGTALKVKSVIEFDQSVVIEVDQKEVSISNQASKNLIINPIS